GSTRPIINGFGYQACVLIYNDQYITLNNLELTNEASHLDSQGNVKKLVGFGGASNDWGSGINVRFGVKIVADVSSLSNFTIDNLKIHNIFPTPTNLQLIHQGYGIKIETRSDTTIVQLNTISNVLIKNTSISETGHYGIWIKSLGLNGIDSVKNNQIQVKSCSFEFTGGSGFVPNKSKNVLVENCTFNHTGSDIDQRMWKRGSGMWPFDCKNVVAQHNEFKNAHGPQDSYGCHIDYGNENVVFQYNYSYNNEGGFVEILGDNINCGYRYNISVNDGYREDPNGTPWNKKGKIFWVSNYCGNSNVRCPNTGTFIYNNTSFTNETIFPEIYFWPNIGDVHVFNNLVYVSPNGTTIPTLIQNNLNTLDISHNLFYDSARIDLDVDLMNNALYNNPNLLNPSPLGVDNPQLYQLQNNSIAIGAGKLINGSLDSTNYLLNNGGRDFFGNVVSSIDPPSIGAYNGTTLNLSTNTEANEIIAYPSITNGEIFLEIKNNGEKIQTKIYSITGNYLTLQEGETINLESFPEGIYILIVQHGTTTEQFKVVKI
ncbi:MAG: right-handed parallel beta-helix repeat-containing protein, partial [Bacteroidota bacterium]|nr:right-handed parallel beta-helix repeat-containing protein [Bacteroidota bacterium]